MEAATFTADEAVTISLHEDDEYLGDDDFQYDAAVISSEEIGQSFVTCALSLSRFGHYATASAALLVLRFELGGPPGNRHRFKSASILARLRPLTPSAVPSLSVLKYAPERWSDAPSAQAIERRLGAGLSAGGAVQASARRAVSYTRHARRHVRGVAAGRPVLCQVQWTLEENEVEQDGLWAHFHLVLLVRHDGPFSIDVGIKTKVGFSADPRKYLLRPLKGSLGTRIVDPTLPIGEADPALDGNPDLRGVDLAGFTAFE
ncbi:hypothetical protein A9K55_007082 [Cordyceps militaris]|uniref:Uncharacterized protein n=1 Tax=Cordyceps militaris TaxID=73501 RepID=A0A2H4SJG3_CORMI|nr:hypothetical protein A9K55_007082 [Cordyceps militaris]